MIDLRDAELAARLPAGVDRATRRSSRCRWRSTPSCAIVGAAIIEANILPRIAELGDDILNELAWAFRLNRLQIWDEATTEGKRALLVNIFAIRKKSGTRFAVRRVFDLLSVVGSSSSGSRRARRRTPTACACSSTRSADHADAAHADRRARAHRFARTRQAARVRRRVEPVGPGLVYPRSPSAATPRSHTEARSAHADLLRNLDDARPHAPRRGDGERALRCFAALAVGDGGGAPITPNARR
jgi:hypothetical protein